VCMCGGGGGEGGGEGLQNNNYCTMCLENFTKDEKLLSV